MRVYEKNLKNLRLLIVDEDPGRALKLQIWLTESLVEFEPKFQFAENYEVALLEYQHQPHDMVVLSRSDSQQKVCEFATHVRASEKTRHTGIVLFYPEEILEDSFVIKCLESGIDDCIASYINPEVRLARFKTIIKLKHMTDALRLANHRLSIMSVTDDLTQLYNMRGFQKVLNTTFQDFPKNNLGVGVLMMDLDFFKRVNDTHNHLAGSKVIADVGSILKTHPFATQALFGRYGGDEYIGILKCKSKADAKAIAEWILLAVRQHVFTYQQHNIKLTCSIGVAWVETDYQGTMEILVKKADECLYKSKQNGRNQVQLEVINSIPLERVG